MKIDKIKLDLAMANKAISSKRLSEECCVSQVTITRVVRGVQEARPETIAKIAKAFKVKPVAIINDIAVAN